MPVHYPCAEYFTGVNASDPHGGVGRVGERAPLHDRHAYAPYSLHRLRAETVMIDQPWDLGASSPSDLQKSGGLGPLAHGFGSGRTSRWPMIRGARRCNTHGDQQRKISLPPLARRPACCSIPIVLDRRKQTVRPAFARASLWSGVESVTSTTWRN